MSRIPVTRYRPVRTADNQGGFTEVFEDPQDIWISIVQNQETVEVRVDENENVKALDVIGVEQEIF